MDALETRAALPGQWDGLEDGFHDLSMDEYLALPLVGSSLCKQVKYRTPAFIRAALDDGLVSDDTSAKSLGTLVHTAIFEPGLFESRYVAKPEPDGERHRTSKGAVSANPANTTAYREEVEALQAKHPGKILVDAAEYAKGIAMRDAVLDHPLAGPLVGLDGPVEQSIIVTDPETGVRAKIRPDKLLDRLGGNLQAKTCRNARWDQLQHDIFRFGYHVSEAFYARMLEGIGWDFRHPFILAIESEGPISADSVVVYEMDAGAMDAGERLVTRYLRQIAWCFEHDTWPGHAQDEVPSISLPEYAWTKVEEEEYDPPACLPPESVQEREVAHV